MTNGRRQWTELWMPPAVADWIKTMSREIRVPAHRVVQVLVDEYIRRLSPRRKRQLFDVRAKDDRRRRTRQ